MIDWLSIIFFVVFILIFTETIEIKIKMENGDNKKFFINYFRLWFYSVILVSVHYHNKSVNIAFYIGITIITSILLLRGYFDIKNK